MSIVHNGHLTAASTHLPTSLHHLTLSRSQLKHPSVSFHTLSRPSLHSTRLARGQLYRQEGTRLQCRPQIKKSRTKCACTALSRATIRAAQPSTCARAAMTGSAVQSRIASTQAASLSKGAQAAGSPRPASRRAWLSTARVLRIAREACVLAVRHA